MKKDTSQYWMLITAQGNPKIISGQLPIYFYKKIAFEQAAIFNCGVREIEINLNPYAKENQGIKKITYKVNSQALKKQLKSYYEKNP